MSSCLGRGEEEREWGDKVSCIRRCLHHSVDLLKTLNGGNLMVCELYFNKAVMKTTLWLECARGTRPIGELIRGACLGCAFRVPGAALVPGGPDPVPLKGLPVGGRSSAVCPPAPAG